MSVEQELYAISLCVTQHLACMRDPCAAVQLLRPTND